MEGWSVDEIICCVIAREIEDGDVLLEGIGAFMPTAGYELARRTHAPGATSVSPIGSVFRTEPATLELSRYEDDTVAAGLRRFSYGDMALWYLPGHLGDERAHWKEFMRPAQVDRWGNTNNVVVGDYARPRVRLPGAVGLPDGAPLERGIYMYVPRHDARTLVERPDFLSTVGLRPPDERPARVTGRPKLLVSDLGVFAFDVDEGLRIRSLHPGVGPPAVRDRTGFEIEIPADVPVTEPPSPEELRVLRDEVDPLGLRRLEMLPSRERWARLRELATEHGSRRGRPTSGAPL